MPGHNLEITSTVRWKGAELIGARKVGAARGATKAAIRLQGDSIPKTPVDVGDLRQAYNVTEANPNDAEPTAILTVDSPYATYQHEEDLHHTPGAQGEEAGQDHYVSSNFTEHGDDYLAIIGGEMRASFNSA